MNENIIPGDNDILSGRGNRVAIHHGNVQFRYIIKQHKEAYRCLEKHEKIPFAKEIVKQIRQMDPPGRFLRVDKESGGWELLPEEDAVTKTSQALREGMATTYPYSFGANTPGGASAPRSCRSNNNNKKKKKKHRKSGFREKNAVESAAALEARLGGLLSVPFSSSALLDFRWRNPLFHTNYLFQNPMTTPPIANNAQGPPSTLPMNLDYNLLNIYDTYKQTLQARILSRSSILENYLRMANSASILSQSETAAAAAAAVPGGGVQSHKFALPTTTTTNNILENYLDATKVSMGPQQQSAHIFSQLLQNTLGSNNELILPNNKCCSSSTANAPDVTRSIPPLQEVPRTTEGNCEWPGPSRRPLSKPSHS